MSSEHVVARADELQDGQMKEVAVGKRKVLLVRLAGEFRAFAGKCPHEGGPLAEGALADGHIRCPWHQAVFDATSGALVEPPSLDALPQYEVRVEGGEVKVVLPGKPAKGVEPAMVAADAAADGRTFAILGSGAAGMAAAEALRAEGFAGRIVMLTRDADPPYDRTALSKGFLGEAEAEEPMLRPREFYERHGIELRTGFDAAAVDVADATVQGGGRSVPYDRLLIATGGTPRTLGVPGERLENVFALRSLASCRRIRGAVAKGGRAVVVGASFIGMEVAASLTDRGMKVTVVAPEPVPLARVFGAEIGRMYQRLHEGKGVAFRLGEQVERFEGDGRLAAAVLAGGGRVEADLAVVGAGVRPATGFLEGLATNDDDSLTVDARLRAAPKVWAAGDVARFPDWRTGEPTRIEHWRVAQQQGRVAAANMAGRAVEYRQVPFFWTNQYWTITQYVGHAARWDEIVFDGEAASGEFLAFYVRDGRVAAVAGCGRDSEMALAAEVLQAEGLAKLGLLKGRLGLGS